ncbi:MAG: hypothetical protein HYV09_17740 [Deltaproteobacteria bacterium]|nr:hypothetical protein [Deltaproteobacteria bacterium]
MATLLARAVRETFRRERIPTRLLWWFSAEGMADWFSLLREQLAPHLAPPPARDFDLDHSARVLAEVARPMLERRYELLRASFPHLPDRVLDPRAPGLVLGALYRIASYPSARWIFAPLGGAPRTFREHLFAERAIAPMPLASRWMELTAHLGELLVSITERMPAHLPRVRPILGEICFSAGERFARRMKRAFELETTPASALELLRMSEYVFRVNPDHWGGADPASNTGWLEGTACPWYDAPGWNGAHCGIFGQFQSGIASAFGLRYQLTSTVPKHGGHVCRIDVRPLELTTLGTKKKSSAEVPS